LAKSGFKHGAPTESPPTCWDHDPVVRFMIAMRRLNPVSTRAAAARRSPSRIASPNLSLWPGPPAATAKHCACGGGCPRCQEEAGHSVHPPSAVHSAAAAEPALPVVTFEPQEGGQDKNGGTKQGDEGASGPGPAAASRCHVQSFSMTVNPWNQVWPNGSGDYVAQLPVDFALELASGVSRTDCLIGQEMKGQVEYGEAHRPLGGSIATPLVDRVVRAYSTWTTDAPSGEQYWWDGNAWHAGGGRWFPNPLGWWKESATFHDAPGFASPSRLGLLFNRGYPAEGIVMYSFPIY
jgi:hypothetical protein